MENKIVEKSNMINLFNIKQLVLTGLLFSLALVLAILENLIPPIFTGVPGVKLGLSNIVVMYAVFVLKKRQACAIAVLKAMFVLITNGLIAGFLSLCGGILSFACMTILLFVFKDKISYLIISIFGAIFHNIGQLMAVSLIYTSLGIFYYLPVLLLSAVAAGLITATLLRFIMPALKRLGLK